VTTASVRLLSTPVLPCGVREAGNLVAAWAAEGSPRVVCAANVHMVMEAWDSAAFAAGLARADLVVCDGRPLVWACRLQGVRNASQTRGMDLMLEVCGVAARRGLKIGIYGAQPMVAQAVRRQLVEHYADLQVGYCWSPPFRQLTSSEDDAVIGDIATAGVQILLVGLGCPKQEQWMLAHRERVSCVMLGVGAAFDMVAGRTKVAPRWMQHAGLEWAFRLASEPRRLWRRYARHNVRFLVLVLGQWLAARCGGHGGSPAP